MKPAPPVTTAFALFARSGMERHDSVSPMARVTVLMPVYNAGAHLAPAIESVLAQTIDDWLLLCVDDGSTDGSAEVIAGYDDPRVVLQRMPANAGQTAALNHGLGIVGTPWVARLDQDDVAAPRRLERQLAYLDEHPGSTLVGAWVDVIDEHGTTQASFRPPSDPDAVRAQLVEQLEHNPFMHSAVTYSAEAARAAGGYPTTMRYAQDYGLWLALAERGEIANVPEVLAFVREHEQQTSRRRSVELQMLEECLLASERLDERLDLLPAARRRWRRSRARVEAHLAIAGAVGRDGKALRRYGGQLARELAREPAALRDVAAVVAFGARRRVSMLRTR